MRSRSWLLLFWSCFVVRGVFYAAAIPYWEGFDEFSHYARIEYLATQGREPLRTTPIPDDVAQSMAHQPAHGVGLSFDDYWKLPPDARAAGFRTIPEYIYEAQQPPVFYWICAVLYRLTWWMTLAAHVFFLRIVCVFFASAAIPLSYLIAKKVVDHPSAALCATALAAALPLFTYTATHVANDSLGIALGAAVVLFTLRRSAIPLALALGAALLTKAYFLAFLPAIALLVIFRSAKTVAVAFAGAAILSGWWYWGNWVHTGSLTGNLILTQPGMRAIFAAIPTFPLAATAIFAWKGFLWMSNWSWIVARPWMYDVITLGVAISLVGIARLLWRRSAEMWLLSAFAAFVALAVLYFGVASYAAGLGAGSHGWYACCVAAPAAVLALAGLRASISKPLVKPLWGPVAVLAVTAIEWFGALFYSMPYYAGLTSHNPQGGLPAATLHLFTKSGRLDEMFQRLTLGKPAALTAGVLFALWIALIAGGLTLATSAILLARTELKTRLALRRVK